MKEEDDGIFFFSSKKKEKKTQRTKNAKKVTSLTFFTHFCIWDEALLLPSPLHIPSTLSSPPSSSFVSQSSVLLKLGRSIEL